MKQAGDVREAQQSEFLLKPAAVAVAMALGMGFGARPALANPTGPTVVNGQVTINQAGNLLSITNSPNAIINWQAFSIGANEITRFTQQSAASAVLNRVIGAGGTIDASVILGALQSNGRVFLLNPSGIVFGPGSQIDVAGLVASSLSLSNADFLGGRLKFTEVPGAGAVVNQGSINAASGGQVYLVGPSVTNSGLITSPKGEVILAAGNTVELVNPGTPNLRVEVSAPDNEAKNLGSIVAEAGRVGIYAGLITHSGTIRADGAVATEDGRIILKATKNVTLDAGSVTTANGPQGGRIEINAGDTTLAAGNIEAKGAAGQGGVVHLLGDKVGIYGNARVDVSGTTGGGTVLAGGEYQGAPGVTAVEGAAIRNATSTFFGADAAIAADASASGDGGKVIVWADNTTRSHGAISARGGAASGDGGFVETSGKLNLDVTRGPDVRAPSGRPGTWLIDPNDLELVAGSEITSNTAQPIFSTLAGSSRIGVDLINLQLNFGSNVMLSTTNQGPVDSGQAGNITVSAPIRKSASTMFDQMGTLIGPFIGTTSLTLQAHNNIVINPGGSIASTGDRLNVTLAANSFSNPGTGMGGVTVNDAIATNGGALTISGRGPVALNAPVSTLRNTGTGAGGSISLTSTAGSVNVSAPAASGSSFDVGGMTGVTIGAQVGALGSVSLDSSTGGVSVLAAMTGSSFQATAGTGVNIGASVTSVNSNIIQTDTGPITITGAMQGAGAFDARTNGAGALMTLAAPVTGSSAFLLADNMEIQAQVNAGSGNITVVPNTAGRPMNLGGETGGSLSLTQTELANFVTNGAKTFGNSSTGALTVSQPIAVGSSAVTIESGTSITVNPGASVTTGVPLDMRAPVTTLNGSISGQSVTLFTDGLTLAPGAMVTSMGNIDVLARTGGLAVNLGVATHGMGSFDLTAGELNQFVTGAGGTLSIGRDTSGLLTIVGPIQPTGTSILRLISGAGIAQNTTPTPATITVPKLELFTFGNTNLPADNNVQVLGAITSGSNFTFTNAASQLLTIGTFGSSSTDISGNATLTVDGFNVASQSFFENLVLMPRTSTVRFDLGGVDAAGRLGIAQADLNNTFAGSLTVKADEGDITGTSVTVANIGKLVLAPLTATRGVNVIADPGPKSSVPGPGGSLDLFETELAKVQGLSNPLSFVVGDSSTGTVTISTPVTAHSSVSELGLQGASLGIGAGLNATSKISLVGNAMTIGAAVAAPQVDVSTNNPALGVDLGSTPGTNLFLDSAALGNVSGSTTRLKVSTTGGAINVNATTSVTTPELTLNAPTVNVAAPLTVNSGVLNLVTNNPVVSAPVRTLGAGAGDISVGPSSAFTSITIGGGAGYLSNFEIGQMGPASGLLRVGDRPNPDNIENTANISVDGIVNTGTLGLARLALVTANGGITQVGSMSISGVNLAARARDNITLNGSNTVPAVSLQSTDGNVSYTNSGTATPLTIGNVDNMSTGPTAVSAGVNAPFGNVTLRTDEIAIANNVSAGNTVTFVPFSAGNPAAISNTKSAGTLVVTPTELDLISAFTLALGNNTTGPITVGTTVNPIGISSLSFVTAPTSTFTVSGSSPITVPFDINVSTGTITTASPMTSTFGNVSLTADAMMFGMGATVSANASFGEIMITPANLSTPINLGGADGGATAVLGLDGLDTGNLSAAFISIGNGAAAAIVTSAGATNFNAPSVTLSTVSGGAITVNAGAPLGNTGNLTLSGGGNAAITLNDAVGSTGGALSVSTGANGSITNTGALTSAGSLTASTGGGGTINVMGPMTSTGNSIDLSTGTMGTVTVNLPISAAGNVTVTADGIAIPGGSVSGANVTLSTLTGTRIVNIGSLAGGDFAYDQATLDRITTPGALTISAGTIDVTSPVTLTTAGSLALRANNMDVAPGGSVTMNAAGGVLSVAPRDFGPMRLGGGTGGLNLTDAEIDRFFVPNGVLRLGDFTASQVSVEGAISVNPTNAGALALIANFNGITQTTNSTISTANLRLQSSGLIDLTQDNAVGMLAGSSSFSSSSAFAFTGTGLLNVGGTVDGVSGLQGANLMLKSDDLALNGPGTIGISNVTLAPRVAGAGMNLGSNPGGVFAVDPSEMGMVTGSNLTFGTTTTGPVTVSGAMQRGSGSLSIVTAPNQTVDVNAAVSAPSGVLIDGGTINVSQPVTSTGQVNLFARAPTTLNVNSPVTGSSVGLFSDVTNINAMVTATQNNGFVFIAPVTAGRPISIGVETAGALSLTPAEFAFISAPNLSIGSNTAGPITMSAPLDLNVNLYSLTSAGAITQSAGAPFRLTRVNAAGQRVGNLDVRTTGTGIGTAPIFLIAANEVPGTVTFDTAGTNNDLDFVNALPLRLQSVINFGVTGRLRLTSAPFVPLPVVIIPVEIDFLPEFNAQLLAAIDKLADINDALRKDEEEKRKAEEERKKQAECR